MNKELVNDIYEHQKWEESDVNHTAAYIQARKEDREKIIELVDYLEKKGWRFTKK